MRKKAFTLIELLVVIAIIAMLLAVILPSLRIAKDKAKQIVCGNNLKQMATAAQLYTLNSDSYYPIAHYTMTGTVSLASINGGRGNTTSAILPPDDKGGDITYQYAWDFTTVTYSDGREEHRSGILWQGDTIDKVHQCPSYKGSDNWSGSSFTGYNYNTSYIGHGEGERVSKRYTGKVIPHPAKPFVKIVMPAKMHQVRSPTSCILFGDGHYSGGANKFMRSTLAWKGDSDPFMRLGGTQGFRHHGQTSIAWADGHVSAQKEYYTDNISIIQSQLEAHNKINEIKIGFLSSDNSLYDLK